MSEIVISGYYGFGNAGDEAMLTAIIETLTDVDPDVTITVISGNPGDTAKRHGVKSVYRLNYLKIAKEIKKSRLLISGGGSLLQDVTSGRSLYYYLSIMLLAKKLGKSVMLYAQGIGPLRGTAAKSAMRYVGNMADFITVRDEGSFQELKRLDITKPPILVTADPVLAMHQVDKQIGRAILKNHKVEGVAPLIGISAREWKDWSHYKTILAQVVDELVTELDAKAVFLPMQYPEDAAVSQKIINRMKRQDKATILNGKYTTGELLSLVGNCDFLIGIRLHALIFAAVMQVPLVGISYDPKIDRFLESIGQNPAGTLKTVSAQSLLESVRASWPNKEVEHIGNNNEDRFEDRFEDKFERIEKRAELINSLRSKAFQNAELAMNIINKKGDDTS